MSFTLWREWEARGGKVFRDITLVGADVWQNN